jgi:hypothetical protein
MTYLKELSQELTIGTKASITVVVLLPRTEPGAYSSNVITHKEPYRDA